MPRTYKQAGVDLDAEAVRVAGGAPIPVGHVVGVPAGRPFEPRAGRAE
jgi:hypothetical protein